MQQNIIKTMSHLEKLPRGNKHTNASDCLINYPGNLQIFYNLTRTNYYRGNKVYIAEELIEMLNDDNIDESNKEKLIKLSYNLSCNSYIY